MPQYRVYSMKYTLGFFVFLLLWQYYEVYLPIIMQDCSTGTGSIIRLPGATNYPEDYGWNQLLPNNNNKIRNAWIQRIIPEKYCMHSCDKMWLFFLLLTHWGRDKMAAVSQTTLSNAFSWTKMLEFRLRFHWSLFLRVQLTIIQHWFR